MIDVTTLYTIGGPHGRSRLGGGRGSQRNICASPRNEQQSSHCTDWVILANIFDALFLETGEEIDLEESCLPVYNALAASDWIGHYLVPREVRAEAEETFEHRACKATYDNQMAAPVLMAGTWLVLIYWWQRSGCSDWADCRLDDRGTVVPFPAKRADRLWAPTSLLSYLPRG